MADTLFRVVPHGVTFTPAPYVAKKKKKKKKKKDKEGRKRRALAGWLPAAWCCARQNFTVGVLLIDVITRSLVGVSFDSLNICYVFWFWF